METFSGDFAAFLETVDVQNREFVLEINEFLVENNCKYEIKPAKRGVTISYVLNGNKRTLATFVFRKSGIKLRIYAEHISGYQDFLNTLPNKTKQEIKKASVCKRLINPNSCNPKCVMGYDFFMEDQHFQKCRYMAFMPTLSDENNPYIKAFLEKELAVINSK